MGIDVVPLVDVQQMLRNGRIDHALVVDASRTSAVTT
jgi:hypothetical protein